MPEMLPMPALDGNPLTLEEYQTLTPERVELLEGYLLGTAEDHEPRLRLMAALLKNEGLLNVVRLAPRRLWEEALKRS